jgi:hypothetical protein
MATQEAQELHIKEDIIDPKNEEPDGRDIGENDK